MKFGSLFSGIGGFDLGFERAGMECVWQVEIDRDCQRVLRNHYAEAERYKDVSTVGKLPTVDVICGGFPCQDLSVAGKRAGLAGERSGLWFQFLRIIESNLPRWIVVENVPGLLSSDEGRDFAAILRGLVECGYCLAWRIFDAQYDGVAQRRRRVFIVGSLGDGSCAEILFESESVSWNPPTRGEAGAGVANSISGGAHPGGHTLHADPPTLVAFSSKDHGADGWNKSDSQTMRVDEETTDALQSAPCSQPAIAFTERTRSEGRALEAQEELAYAVTNPGSGGRTHSRQIAGGFGVRRLTPRECERLQGFPDDWTLYDSEGKEISDSGRYRMLGNAVAVPVAKWIGTRIVEIAKGLKD